MSSVLVSPRRVGGGGPSASSSPNRAHQSIVNTTTTPRGGNGTARTDTAQSTITGTPLHMTGGNSVVLFTGHEGSPRKQRVGDYGPRIGASLSMRKTDLVVEDTLMRSQQQAASVGNGPPPSTAASPRGGASASLSGRDLRDGIHISIPAPPPSWSGGGSQSSALHRSFLGANSSGKPRPGQMVTVVESPFYTHKSSKEQLRNSELKNAEETCCTLSTQAAAASVSRGGKPHPRGAGNIASSSYGRSTGTTDAVGAMMVVAPTYGASASNVVGASPTGTINSSGTVVEISTKDSFDAQRGEERISSKVKAAGGNESRALIVSTRSIDRCVAETLAQGAIRKAEVEAATGELFDTPSPQRRAGGNNNAGTVTVYQSPQQSNGETNAGDTTTSSAHIAGASGVHRDLGRDRVLCSSPRFGHRSGALHKASNESHQQVGFAIAIAATLSQAGPAVGSPRLPGERPVRLDLSDLQIPTKPSSAQHNERSLAISNGGGASTTRPRPVEHDFFAGEEGPVPPFMVASPRFPREQKSVNPPVGHYHARHHAVDSKLVRDVHLGASKREAYDAKKVEAGYEHERTLIAEEKRIRLEVGKEMLPGKQSELDDDAAGGLSAPYTSSFMRPIHKVLPRGTLNQQQDQQDGASAPQSPGGTMNLGVGSAAGVSPFGAFNEDALSTNKRTPCFAKLGKATGRDRQEGWDRTPDPTKPNTSSESYYTGSSLGDGLRDAKSTTKVLVNMDNQSGRSARLHSHQAAQHSLAGGVAPGSTQPATSLDTVVVQDPHKFKNTMGSSKTSMVNMDKQAARGSNLHRNTAANTVSSDYRNDALSVVFDGKSSTKSPRPPGVFAKQTARPQAHAVSTCAVDSYDVDYSDGKGGVVEGLRTKNDLLSPRTRSTDFNRMGSHTDTSSFANLAERNRQHDAAHGVGQEELAIGLNQTRPRIVRNVDFANLAPRKDKDSSYPTFTESCADPDRIFPKHILEKNTGGNPMLGKHINRETRSRARGPQVARVTDNFYDYEVSYTAELGKVPKNPVNISKCSGRDAYGQGGNNFSGTALGAPRGGGSGGESRRVGSSSPVQGGGVSNSAHLGPGTYDPKYDTLSKPTVSQK